MASRSRLVSHLSATLIGVLFAFVLSQFSLDVVQGVLIDVLYRLQFWQHPDPSIALVKFDDHSAERYPGTLKVPAEEIAQVLSSVAVDKPRAVLYLGPVNEQIYSDIELRLIARQFSQIKNGFIGFTDDISLNHTVPDELQGHVQYYPGIISHDTFSYGADSVTRRVMISIDGVPTVYSKVARLVSQKQSAYSSGSYFGGRMREAFQAFIAYQGRPPAYPAFSSIDVANRTFGEGKFTDKIVLIGSGLSQKKEDFVFTPYSRAPRKTLALEAAAQGLVTLIRDDGLKRSSEWFNFFLSLVIALVTVNLVLYFSPGGGILFVVGEALGILVVGGISLYAFHLWLDLAHPFIIASLGYYLVIPYRLVEEYRKRWHYQEKSEFMGQLEQLKSNFLSLISHDLKTPIARIQGNAELILGEEKDSPEAARQRKWVESIVATTQDLSEYVETILDLTRIESAKVPLKKSTKDINATILEVVASKRSLAAEKNITINTKLEPLFSFKFDVRLMHRVISNLVENSIKYSPPNTVITLSTEEDSNWVRIHVKDQGFGIPEDDKEKIFEKFYRAEAEATKNIKGTGLGLYLVKYFVELHQGVVGLTSELGKGSEFTVSLPV